MRDPEYGERHLAAAVVRRLIRAHPNMLVHNALVRVIISYALTLLAEEFPNTARIVLDRRRRQEPGQIHPTPPPILRALERIYASQRGRELAKKEELKRWLRMRRVPDEVLLTPEEFVALMSARREADHLGMAHRVSALNKAIRALRR